MENLIISFNAVSPMFIIMLLGALIKWRKMISRKTGTQLNNLAFRIFIPVLLVYSIYSTDLREILQVKLIVFTVLSVTLMWLVSALLIMKIEKTNTARGAMIQGMCRSNYVLFGLSLLINLYGVDNIGIPSLIAAVVLLLFNVLSVITLEVFRDSKVEIKEIALEVLKNPLIIAVAAGIMISLLHIRLPLFIENTVASLSGMAMPIALVAMGASLSFDKAFINLKNIVTVIVGKLIVIPLIFVPAAIFLGFRGIELTSLMVMFASPTAVTTYTMADQMESDANLASSIVILSTVLSCFTMFFWIFSIKQIGMI
jgi:predicted permease